MDAFRFRCCESNSRKPFTAPMITLRARHRRLRGTTKVIRMFGSGFPQDQTRKIDSLNNRACHDGELCFAPKASIIDHFGRLVSFDNLPTRSLACFDDAMKHFSHHP